MVSKNVQLAIGVGGLALILGAGAYTSLRDAYRSARDEREAAAGEGGGGAGTQVAVDVAAPPPGVAAGQADGAARGPEAPPPVQGPPAPLVVNLASGFGTAPSAPRDTPDVDLSLPPGGIPPENPSPGSIQALENMRFDDYEIQRLKGIGGGSTALMPERDGGSEGRGGFGGGRGRPPPRTPALVDPPPIPIVEPERDPRYLPNFNVPPSEGPGGERGPALSLIPGQSFTQRITPNSQGGDFTVRPTPQPIGALRVRPDGSRMPTETAGEQRNRIQEEIASGTSARDATAGAQGTLGSGPRDGAGGRPGDARGQEVIQTGSLADIRELAAQRLAEDLARTPNLNPGTGPRRPDGPQGAGQSDLEQRRDTEAERAAQTLANLYPGIGARF